MVKDYSDSEKGNPLPPHRLLLSINQLVHSSQDNPLRPFSFPTQVCSVYLLFGCFPNCITIDHMTKGGLTNGR